MAPSLIQCLVAGSWLLAGNTYAAFLDEQRFAAAAIAAAPMETGSPALMPRAYYAAPAHPLQRRDDVCNEIGAPGENACCPNNSYCIVNSTSPTPQAACCRIGATCSSPSSPCKEPNLFLCPTTVTSVVSGTLTTTSLSSACCSRSCTVISEYQCPLSLGGGCCPNDQHCGAGRVCLSTVLESSSSTASWVLTPVPEGCKQGEVACAADQGGGCCAATLRCTRVDGRGYCAARTDLPEGVNGEAGGGGDGSGLSAGAKAGIGVGVVVASGILIGLGAWFCLRRRRGRSGAGSGAAGAGRPRVREGQTIGGGGVAGDNDGYLHGGGGGGGGVPSAGEAGGAYSEDTTGVVSRSAQPGLAGLAQGYRGGDPALGPYSDDYYYQGSGGGSPPSAATSPGIGYGGDPAGGFGVPARGVPVVPDRPGDIAAPVEIDSRLRGEGSGGLPEMAEDYRGHSRAASGSGNASGAASHAHAQGYFGSDGGGRPRADTNLSGGAAAEDASDRFELYGSDPGQLSPLSSPYGYPTPPEEYNNGNNNNQRRR
ncbi:hypothetical protein QBC42DRAFT_302018 [Cladorrhinum samala]|uniref:Uncharacterized protein n=1 Tax=Cladorrhinum samala TaxID=585594 RepID=A0AAV9H809_9PEZI|nr:hypothetical protein QBC42DRAFT_302018 [Cladorrhinum samala]